MRRLRDKTSSACSQIAGRDSRSEAKSGSPERKAGSLAPKSRKFQRRLNAGFFDFFLVSADPQVDLLVGETLSMMRRKGLLEASRHRSRYERTTAAIVLNLYVAYKINPGRYVTIPLGQNAYSSKSRYLAKYASRAIFAKTLKGLGPSGSGFVEVVRGFRDRRTGKGFLTRIRATARLKRAFKTYGLARYMVGRSSEFESVELKNDQKVRINYRDTAETKSMRNTLARINGLIEGSFIGLKLPDAELRELSRRLRETEVSSADDNIRRPIDLTRRLLYRIFNDGSFEIGGRFYGGWWQSIPSEYRKHIYVAQEGELTPSRIVEIDYSSMQPRLAYAQVSACCPNDAYSVPQLGRDDAKRVRPLLKAGFLRMLNTKSRVEAIEALQSHYKEEGITGDLPNPEVVVHMIELLHPPLAPLFYTYLGKRLMNTESRVTELVLLEMFERNVMVLPVHDSFLVAEKHRELLAQVMADSFERIAGAEGFMSDDETESQFFVRKLDEEIESGELAALVRAREQRKAEIAQHLKSLVAGGVQFSQIVALLQEAKTLSGAVTLNPLHGMDLDESGRVDLTSFLARQEACKEFNNYFMSWLFGGPEETCAPQIFDLGRTDAVAGPSASCGMIVA